MRDLTNQRFGLLLVVSQSDTKHKSKSIVWNCICDCGSTLELVSPRLLHNKFTHCGCQPRELNSHGMTGTPTYTSWQKLCSRTRSVEYEEWHGDVAICDRWDTTKGGSFDNFLEDMGVRPEGTTINHINGAKIYSKETCEWATLSVQSFDQKRKNTNKSGRTGVRWREERGVWESRIAKDGEQIMLYYGPSFDEACKAREEAELKYYGFTKE